MSSFGLTGTGASIGNGLGRVATSFNESNLRAPTGGSVSSTKPQGQGGQADSFDAIGEYIRKALDERFGPSGTVKPQGNRISYDNPPAAPKKQIGIGYDL